ncbi:MAG: hypothetical protein ACJ76I_09630 [Gaiellaceae bacterium]
MNVPPRFVAGRRRVLLALGAGLAGAGLMLIPALLVARGETAAHAQLHIGSSAVVMTVAAALSLVWRTTRRRNEALARTGLLSALSLLALSQLAESVGAYAWEPDGTTLQSPVLHVVHTTAALTGAVALFAIGGAAVAALATLTVRVAPLLRAGTHATALPAARLRPRRRLGIAAVLLTVGLWTLNFGLIDLLDGFTGFVDQSRNQVLDAGWGAVFGILLPLGLLAQVRRPIRRIAGLQQMALVLLALVIAALGAEEWRYFGLVAAVAFALAILLALHPARDEFLNARGRAKPTLALAAAVAAAPCLVYTARMTSAQRRHLPPLDAVTNGLDHWTAMAALALSVLLLVLLASLGTRGWRIPAWSAALAAAAWGTSSLTAPEAHPAGGAGRGWAYAAIGWAIAVGACALLEARRESKPSQLQITGTPRSVRIRLIAFSVAGTLGVVRGLIGYWNPTYWAPTTLLDWTSVIAYTCFLIAAAVSLALLAIEQRPLSRWPITAAAGGAAAAGVANAIEDGFGVNQFGYPFAAGVALMAGGLLFGGAALTLSRAGARHLGLLLVANVAALALAFDDLGLILFGSAWLLMAALLARKASRLLLAPQSVRACLRSDRALPIRAGGAAPRSHRPASRTRAG